MLSHSQQCKTLTNNVDYFPGSALVTLANFLSVPSHICLLTNTTFFIALHCCALLDKKKKKKKKMRSYHTCTRIQVSQHKKLELQLQQLMYMYIVNSIIDAFQELVTELVEPSSVQTNCGTTLLKYGTYITIHGGYNFFGFKEKGYITTLLCHLLLKHKAKKKHGKKV